MFKAGPKADTTAVVGIHDDEELAALKRPTKELAGQWKAVYGSVT
jgi:hypothetical protein